MTRKLEDLSLDLFRVFGRVAELGSMTRAARALFVTQPAVSHAVRQLEEGLGYPLFSRSGKELRLTPEGKKLLRAWREGLRAVRAAESEIDELHLMKGGVVTIGVPYFVLHNFLLPFLREFHAAHPGVRLRLRIENRMKELLAIAAEEQTDLVVLMMPEGYPVLPPLAAERVGSYRYCLMASRAQYGSLEGREVSVAEAAKLPILVLREGNNTRTYFNRVFAEAGTVLNPLFEGETMAVVEDLTEAGFGVGAMIESREDLEKRGLFRLDVPLPKAEEAVAAITRAGTPGSKPAEVFLSLLRRGPSGLAPSRGRPRSPSGSRPSCRARSRTR